MQTRIAATIVNFDVDDLRRLSGATIYVRCNQCSRIHAVQREATLFASESHAELTMAMAV